MNDDVKGDEVKKYKGAYKSKYFGDAKLILDQLNSVSPSFCLAKWYNVSIHIPTGMTHSCYHPPSHHIPLEELKQNSSALHNTEYKKKQRTKMLNGERPEECSFCWQIEDQGNISDRAYRSNDVYDEDAIQQAIESNDPNPKYVEVNFNQACNLKCSYCSPHLSTEWHKEVKKYGSYKLIDKEHNHPDWVDGLNIDNSPSNPYINAFWDWFPIIYKDLKTFRMTGGEPLMDKNTFKVFDYVKRNPHSDLQLSITSNCCPPKGQWNKFMRSLSELTSTDSVDHFMLFCSLDSWGAQAEYIRNGLDFDTLYRNITDFLENGSKHSLTFIITANLLSLPNWKTYIENILDLRIKYNTDRQLIWFDTPMLHDPKWQSMKLASRDMLQPLLDSIEFMEQHKETSSNRFKGFKDFEIDKVKRLYSWALEPLDVTEDKIARQNFAVFFKEHDRRRDTNITNTFPTMAAFIEDCNRLNNSTLN